MTAVLESDVVLRDGTQVHLRPILPEDAPILIDAFQHLSAQTIYQRFFSALPELSAGMARHLANVNFINRFALVAEVGDQLIGVGRYERTSDPAVVELGLLVLDAWQNRGLGRILLREVVQAAQRQGIHRFRADVLSENRRMLRLLATEGELSDRRTEAGITSLSFTPRK